MEIWRSSDENNFDVFWDMVYMYDAKKYKSHTKTTHFVYFFTTGARWQIVNSSLNVKWFLSFVNTVPTQHSMLHCSTHLEDSRKLYMSKKLIILTSNH